MQSATIKLWVHLGGFTTKEASFALGNRFWDFYASFVLKGRHPRLGEAMDSASMSTGSRVTQKLDS